MDVSISHRNIAAHRGLTLAFLAGSVIGAFTGPASAATQDHSNTASQAITATPIKHLVVIFDENISFDHYFGTYPHATNTDGEPWHARADTPRVNGLTKVLLFHNPNKDDPERLDPSEAYTCDNDHDYKNEQQAYDRGLVNKFVQHTSRAWCPNKAAYDPPGLAMDYFDGNTVTALWNYAQHFAISDNNFGSNFGPSTPGAINVVSGDTHGAVAVTAAGQRVKDFNQIASANMDMVGTLVKDPDPSPMYDRCVTSLHSKYHAFFEGRNIGNLLTAHHVTWGWFSGGFTPTSRRANGNPVCASSHDNIGGMKVVDYQPHHEPFQYYKSTSNPKHLEPSSVGAIGHTDQANHQYGLRNFYAALAADNLPSVSYIKPPAYEDGHPGYSDPLDEQRFLAQVVNAIEKSPAWATTAIIITYDDSDGWYDHVMSSIVNPSSDPMQDRLTAHGVCGEGHPMHDYLDRCGYGPRLPLLLISPYSKVNFVYSSMTDQTSVLRFIEHNWLRDERIGDGSYDKWAGSLDGMFDWTHPHDATLLLNDCTGEVLTGGEQQPVACHWPKQVGQVFAYKGQK